MCWFNCLLCLHLAFNFHKLFNGRYKSIKSIVGSFRSFPLTLLRRPGWRWWIKTYIQLFICQHVCRDWSLSYGSSLKLIAWKTWLLSIFFHLKKKKNFHQKNVNLKGAHGKPLSTTCEQYLILEANYSLAIRIDVHYLFLFLFGQVLSKAFSIWVPRT